MRNAFSISIIASLAALLLIGAGCSPVAVKNTAEQTLVNAQEQTTRQLENAAADTGQLANTIKDNAGTIAQDILPEEISSANEAVSAGAGAADVLPTVTKAAARYVDYSPQALADAQKASKTVLYFHANWCPVCVALEPDLKTRIGEFPAGVTILKVDYDSATDLKKKYGVTYQHTFVQVDASGSKIKLWSGGDVETIMKNII